MKTFTNHYVINYYFDLGVYVPLTAEGNIEVNGIFASCHASADHDMAQFAMIPVHWYPEIIEWIFGMNNGFKGYVNIANDLGGWVLPHESY